MSTLLKREILVEKLKKNVLRFTLHVVGDWQVNELLKAWGPNLGNTDFSVDDAEKKTPQFSVGVTDKPDFSRPEKDSKMTNRDPCFVLLYCSSCLLSKTEAQRRFWYNNPACSYQDINSSPNLKLHEGRINQM